MFVCFCYRASFWTCSTILKIESMPAKIRELTKNTHDERLMWIKSGLCYLFNSFLEGPWFVIPLRHHAVYFDIRAISTCSLSLNGANHNYFFQISFIPSGRWAGKLNSRLHQNQVLWKATLTVDFYTCTFVGSTWINQVYNPLTCLFKTRINKCEAPQHSVLARCCLESESSTLLSNSLFSTVCVFV